MLNLLTIFWEAVDNTLDIVRPHRFAWLKAGLRCGRKQELNVLGFIGAVRRRKDSTYFPFGVVPDDERNKRQSLKNDNVASNSGRYFQTLGQRFLLFECNQRLNHYITIQLSTWKLIV